jgi:RNA polymerase sigma-70 factor (ECF subfamily)
VKHDPFADLEPLVQRVYAYVAYRLGDGPDAERVTKQTFEMAFRHRGAFDPRQDDPLVWLTSFARWHLEQRALPEPVAAEYSDLRGAVETLPENDRELVALRYGAELSPAQVGAILELEPAAVDAELGRILVRLRHTTVLVV